MLDTNGIGLVALERASSRASSSTTRASRCTRRRERSSSVWADPVATLPQDDGALRLRVGPVLVLRRMGEPRPRAPLECPHMRPVRGDGRRGPARGVPACRAAGGARSATGALEPPATRSGPRGQAATNRKPCPFPNALVPPLPAPLPAGVLPRGASASLASRRCHLDGAPDALLPVAAPPRAAHPGLLPPRRSQGAHPRPIAGAARGGVVPGRLRSRTGVRRCPARLAGGDLQPRPGVGSSLGRSECATLPIGRAGRPGRCH